MIQKKKLFIFALVAFMLLISVYVFMDYLNHQKIDIDYFPEKGMVFQNDSDNEVIVKIHYTNELLKKHEKSKSNPNADVKKRNLPFLRKMTLIYDFWTGRNDYYFLDDFYSEEKTFFIQIPEYTELFFNEHSLRDSCYQNYYSHIDITIIKDGIIVKSFNIDFLDWCKLKEDRADYLLKVSELLAK